MAATSPNCGSSSSGSSSAGDGPIRPNAQAVDDPMRSDDPEIWTASPFRVALPQVLATLAQSLLLLALGMMVAVPTVVIAALRTPDHPDHPPTGLHLDDTQASWFVGILLGCQPLGSLLSGWLSEALGRKRCMMAVSAPQLAGWLLLACSDDILHLYLSALLMGFSIGFMEAPGLSYVGEITQPHLRANMCSLNSLNVPLGYLVMYLLGSLMTWRHAAMASAALPLVTLAALSMVPESPLWLLRRGRDSEAEASLCWLRGWVTPEEVRAELAATRAYSDRSRIRQTRQTRQTTSTATGQVQLYIEVPANGNGPRLAHRDVVSPKPGGGGGQTLCEKIKDLARPAMMRPLRLVVVYFFFYHCAGLTGVRPYMIQVFTELQFPLNPYWITVASAALQIAGGVLCMLTIHRAGKRLISMVSIAACSLCLLLLAVYSFGRFRQPTVPMALFGALFFFTNLGIAPVPWALISEVFPPRGRGVGGGLSSALYYMMYFAVSKTFLDVRTLAGGLGGVFLLYGALGVLGLLFVYFCLPETEGKDLADIERFFSGGHDHDTRRQRQRQPINA